MLRGGITDCCSGSSLIAARVITDCCSGLSLNTARVITDFCWGSSLISARGDHHCPPLASIIGPQPIPVPGHHQSGQTTDSDPGSSLIGPNHRFRSRVITNRATADSRRARGHGRSPGPPRGRARRGPSPPTEFDPSGDGRVTTDPIRPRPPTPGSSLIRRGPGRDPCAGGGPQVIAKPPRKAGYRPPALELVCRSAGEPGPGPGGEGQAAHGPAFREADNGFMYHLQW